MTDKVVRCCRRQWWDSSVHANTLPGVINAGCKMFRDIIRFSCKTSQLPSNKGITQLQPLGRFPAFLPPCLLPGPERNFKKKRSATAPTWRMEDDSASPRNSDPSVVSQALPWGMTQADLKFKFCLHKYVQKVCYLTLTSVVGGKHFLFPALKSVENSNWL